MPVNSFNVGRDIAFAIYDNNQQAIVSFSIVTGFERKQEMKEIKVDGLDGVVRYAFLPNGWKGSIEIDRANNSVDRFFATMEALYYSGANVLGGTIQETITEADGTITQFRYERVAFHLSEAGNWKGDAAVKMKIEIAASFRKLVG